MREKTSLEWTDSRYKIKCKKQINKKHVKRVAYINCFAINVLI